MPRDTRKVEQSLGNFGPAARWFACKPPLKQQPGSQKQKQKQKDEQNDGNKFAVPAGRDKNGELVSVNHPSRKSRSDGAWSRKTTKRAATDGGYDSSSTGDYEIMSTRSGYRGIQPPESVRLESVRRQGNGGGEDNGGEGDAGQRHAAQDDAGQGVAAPGDAAQGHGGQDATGQTGGGQTGGGQGEGELADTGPSDSA